MPYKDPQVKKENNRHWYAANREKQKAASAKWQAENRERVRELHRRRYAANPEKARAYYREYYARCVSPRAREINLKRKFGMTVEQHDALMAAQGHRCAGCGGEEPGTKSGWHTDHDHRSGKVRGILCHGCNLTLGLVKDCPTRLRALADYVEKHAA